jgi:hypothetical protein
VLLSLALDRVLGGLWGYSVPFRVQWDFLLGTNAGWLAIAVLIGRAGLPASASRTSP